MIFQVVIVIISFFLDGILTNFLPYMINDLSLFTPYFTIVSLIIICPFFKKQINKYYILVGIVGFLYDLFYTNLLFANTIFFLLLALIIVYLYKKLESNMLTTLFFIILIIVIYHLIYAISLLVFNVVPININNILYLIGNSLILNIIYGEILYLICKYLPHKRHIN